MSSGTGIGRSFKKTTGMGAQELSYGLLGPVGLGYGAYKGQQNLREAEAERRGAEVGAAQAQTRKVASQLADERRRRRLLLLNPSMQTNLNLATGRNQLLGA